MHGSLSKLLLSVVTFATRTSIICSRADGKDWSKTSWLQRQMATAEISEDGSSMLQRQALTAEIGTKGVVEYSSIPRDHQFDKQSALEFLRPLELIKCTNHELQDLESLMQRNHKHSLLRKVYMFHLYMTIKTLDKQKNASDTELQSMIDEFIKHQSESNKSCPAKLLYAKHQLNQLNEVFMQLASKINTTTAAIQSLQDSIQKKMKALREADKFRKQELANCASKEELSIVQGKSVDLSKEVSINFQKSKLLHSNLGGKGPSAGAKEMLFKNVGVAGGQSIDLEITNTTVYAANNVKSNRQVAKLGGSINGKAPEPLGFRFRFVRSGTKDPVVLERFYFSFLDLDRHGSKQCAEQIELRGFDEYYVTTTNTLAISTDVHGFTRFRAKEKSAQGDNPRDVNSLTMTQANRAVTFLFTERSEFEVFFQLANSKKGGGNLFFTGTTSLVTKSQGEAHSAGVTDQTCAKDVEAAYHRKAGPIRDSMSEDVKELTKMTDDLPRLRPRLHDVTDAEAELRQHVEHLSKACKALPATISDLDAVRKGIDALKSCPGLGLPKFQVPVLALPLVSFVQNIEKSQDVLDKLMLDACRSRFPNLTTVRVAEISEIENQLVEGLPQTNTATQALLGACPNCQGRSSGLRVCWDPKEALIRAARRDDCGDGIRVVPCVHTSSEE